MELLLYGPWKCGEPVKTEERQTKQRSKSKQRQPKQKLTKKEAKKQRWSLSRRVITF